MAFDDINVPKSKMDKSAFQLPEDNEPSFVYDNVEVVKTGRKAGKTLSSGKMDIQYEVTPKSHINGNWKKWVRDSDLYEVTND